MSTQKLNHILLNKDPQKSRYTNPKTGRADLIKDQNRKQHGEYLKNRLNESIGEINNEISLQGISRDGFYLEFKGESNFDLPINSLETRRSKNPQKNIRLLNIRKEENSTLATVYIPNEKSDYFLNKIDKYLEEETKNDEPKNKRLINNLRDVRSGMKLGSFWSDYKKELPSENSIWCEVWLSSTSNKVKDRFNNILNEQNISSDKNFIDFPERSVKLVFANKAELEKLTLLSDDLAELRKAKETASFWVKSPNIHQAEWGEDLINRTILDSTANTSVCILDTGVNSGHPLLNSILQLSDCQSVENSWGINDHDGHGTLMAGISTYGDLISCLESSNPIHLNHKLESVKILPDPINGTNKPELWGNIISRAVSLSEINKPNRNRVFCMAVTSEDTKDQGRPTSWSGSIDQITSGAIEDGKPKRLFIISNGNVSDFSRNILNYPDFQLLESIHDPAQSWNCISVGAYTSLINIQDPIYVGYIPLAPEGGLSPFSTTSILWKNDWPIKPDVLFEGGNVANPSPPSRNPHDVDCKDLSLLSTYFDPATSLFNQFNMTSAATAEAAWFASQIQTKYSNFWPETIRGLIIHSAEWNTTLIRQFLPDLTKNNKLRMLRICGYGIPNLDNALYSASNKLTLIVQNEIQPYDKVDGRIVTNEMHLYDLPWPKSVLLGLPENIRIKMRVTLSYFIEPGPGEIGWKYRYKYPSHTLKFFINSPTETKKEFEMRINKKAREEMNDSLESSEPSDHWYFGASIRHKGSIHSDIWEGTPQELAASNYIAIVPGNGWWKDRAYLNLWNQKSRYSLIVSISSPGETIDIYTPVINQIKVPILINSQ